MRMMRTIMLFAVFLACMSASAQVENFGVFKHIGADVNVSSKGIGFDVASPVTNYIELSFGANFMPGFKIKGDVDVNADNSRFPGLNIDEVNVEGKLSRTTFDFKASVYPFGAKNAFFVTAGLSFGGKKIAKLTGHSEDVKNYLAQYPQYRDQIVAEIDKYNLKFDDNGDILGDIRVKAVRPYVGLGYGRLVPKHRVGFRVELGAEFMGKMKIYQNDQELDTNDLEEKGDDDISDFVDKFKVYPVLKFSLSGRIL